MIPGLAKDLAYMLGDAGVAITLGAGSTDGWVRAADAESLQQAGVPVSVVGPAILVIIAVNSLPDLANDVVFTVLQGPLAGRYTADHVMACMQGNATLFLGYPA